MVVVFTTAVVFACLAAPQRADAAATPTPRPTATATTPATAATPGPTVDSSAAPPGVGLGSGAPTPAGPSVSPSGGSVDGGGTYHPGVFDIAGHIRKAINDWFAGLVTAAFKPILDLLSRTLLATPQLTVRPRPARLWLINLGIADSLLGLLILAGGATVMGYETLQTRLAAKELAPRIVVAGIAANVSLAVLGLAISLADALAHAVLAGTSSKQAVNGLSQADPRIGGREHLPDPGRRRRRRPRRRPAGDLATAARAGRAARHRRTAGADLPRPARHRRASEVVVAGHHRHPAGASRPIHWSWSPRCGCSCPAAGLTHLGVSAGGGLVNLLVAGCLCWVMVRIPTWTSRLVFTSRSSGGIGRTVRQVAVFKAIRAIGAAL